MVQLQRNRCLGRGRGTPRGHSRGRIRARSCRGGGSWKFWFLFIFANVLLSEGKKSMNLRQIEKRILDRLLDPVQYERMIRPDGIDGEDATVVHINMFVRSIGGIDDVKMEYSLQLTFREEWVDERLRFDYFQPKPPKELHYLTLTNYSQIWVPDLFFSNEIRGHLHSMIKPNLYVRIHPNGGILFSLRISLTLSCPMILKMFPMDKQTCALRMASYGWTKDDLIFKWKNDKPVQITPDLHLPRFSLEQFSTDYCDSVTNTGTYSCLRVDLLFKRQFSFYLVQIYIPSCMLVIVSWVSFWLDPDAVPARVPLGVTTLLTMVTQTSGINQKLPPVSYTKALDVWTGVCLSFVFGALLEYALVNYTARKDRHRAEILREKKKWNEEEFKNRPINALCPLESELEGNQPLYFFGYFSDIVGPKTWLSRFPSRAKRIDVIARIVFPLLFLFFNLAYWSAYCMWMRG